MTALRFDVVMLEDGSCDSTYRLGGGKLVPDEGAYRIEAKVSTPLEIENCGFAVEIARDLIRRRAHDGIQGYNRDFAQV